MTAVSGAGAGGPYLRGGSVVPLEGRRLGRALGVLGLTVVAVIAVILTVDAARNALVMHHLDTRGQKVQVTVTGCLGRASGTGITPVGYTCRGGFTLRGHRYRAVIQGSSRRHPSGETLSAITDPRDPRVLFTIGSLARAPSPGRGFILPAALFGLVLAGAGYLSRSVGPARTAG